MLHTVDRDDTYSWDAIHDLVAATGTGYVASQGKPAEVPLPLWAQNVSPLWYDYDGVALAEHVYAALISPTGPAYVAVDELRGGSIQCIYEFASWMRRHAPEFSRRWGVYIVDGPGVSYTNLNPAIDAILDASGGMHPEFYPLQSSYMGAGETTGVRDQWLSDYVYGAGPNNYGRGFSKLNRLHWLMQHRRTRGSVSRVTPVFGVTDRFLNGPRAAVFLDRLMYVFLTRTGYGGLMAANNGGCGSWKWQREAVSSTSRDLAFARSWRHYCNGSRSSLMGPVT